MGNQSLSAEEARKKICPLLKGVKCVAGDCAVWVEEAYYIPGRYLAQSFTLPVGKFPKGCKDKKDAIKKGWSCSEAEEIKLPWYDCRIGPIFSNKTHWRKWEDENPDFYSSGFCGLQRTPSR